MSRRIFRFVEVFFLVAASTGLAQEAPKTSPPSVPAATRFETDCSGFVARARLSEDIYVLDGADNDTHSPMRQYVTGDSIFLSSRGATNLSVGAEYWLLRRANESFRPQWYDGQSRAIRSLGTPYEDVGRVRVSRVTPQGVIANVVYACGPVYPGDFAVAYQPRTIPEYTASTQFDTFALPNEKLVGVISAARNNMGVLGTGSIAYINLGETAGVRIGQRFRIFRMVYPDMGGLLVYPLTPRQSLGEMIILSTQEKSSVGMVVSSIREISLGDGVQLE